MSRDIRDEWDEPRTPTPIDLDPRAFELTRVARKNLGQMSPAQRARGRDGLRRHMARKRRAATWGLALASVASVAAGLLVVPRLMRHTDLPPPLSFRLDDGALAPDGAIRAGEDAEPALRFIDGTVIKLAPGSHGRLATVDGLGARVAIEDGSAQVSVVPKPHARWVIEAGPFSIAVHGTVFTAAWDKSGQRLDVRLERGVVSVTGPVASGPIAMRTGQHLTVTVKQPRVLLRDLDDLVDELDGQEKPADEAPAAPAHLTAASAAPAKLARPARPVARSWIAALSVGDFEGILAEAQRDLGRALGARSTDELAALADAARYLRHDDVARQALHAQRRRFAGSARATDAAFFLGRLDENSGGLGRALRWYDRYLAESPDGSYAAEALGRKMIAIREVSGPAAARDVAEEYVRRFPRGSYAGAARALRRD